MRASRTSGSSREGMFLPACCNRVSTCHCFGEGERGTAIRSARGGGGGASRERERERALAAQQLGSETLISLLEKEESSECFKRKQTKLVLIVAVFVR